MNISPQHQYHSKIDDQIDKTLAGMNQGLLNKLMSVLEASLSKLSRYDEGSLIGSILSFTVSFGDFLSVNYIKYLVFLTECIRIWQGSGPRICEFHTQ